MFSLPNINAMNNRAAADYERTKNKTPKQIPRGQKCEWCDSKATTYYNWYDLFSNVPKGKIFLCDEHDGYYGNPSEGYFTCAECQKVFTENYTWENYFTINDGDMLCLNCALDRYLAEPENWIQSPKEITWNTIEQTPHLIPVQGTYHEDKLVFHGNVEFDIMDGHNLAGGDEVKELQDIVRKAIIKHGECILILDAGYQFSISIGVYTRKE